MALIGNGSVLHKSPGRFLNGYGTTGGGIASMRCGFNKHGMMRNAYEQFDAKSATPYGHLSGSAWVLPKTAGGMSSRNVTSVSLAPTGLAVGGVTTDAAASITFAAADAQAYPLDDASPLRTGATTISFVVADATGQLISSGSGTADMSFTFAPSLLTASIGGVGEATFSFSTNTPLLGATAGGEGSASVSFSSAATVLPTDDTAPARTGTASFTFTGTLSPYAIGTMSGSTAGGALSEATIAAAVWGASIRTLTSGGGGGGGATAEETAAAVRVNLATELARIDAATSTRATLADIFAAV